MFSFELTNPQDMEDVPEGIVYGLHIEEVNLETLTIQVWACLDPKCEAAAHLLEMVRRIRDEGQKTPT